MKQVTIVISCENGVEGKNLPKLSQELFGGKVTAMAAYDCIEALEIAEDALIGDSEDRQIAIQKLSKLGVKS